MQQPSVVVFAASSLTNALQAAGQDFEKTSGVRVLLNVGASNSQARQILAGAPADLFCSADDAQMDAVERGGKLVVGSRIVLAFNHLVVVTHKDAGSIGAIADLVTDPNVRRIAIGDPAAVPAGVYTREYLQHVGLWERLQPKLVPTTNVRAALAAVEAGNADAAFVYATDAPTAPHVSVAFRVPDADSPPIVYPAAVVSSGKNADGGRKFLAFLEGPEGRAILTRFGFTVPK